MMFYVKPDYSKLTYAPFAKKQQIPWCMFLGIGNRQICFGKELSNGSETLSPFLLLLGLIDNTSDLLVYSHC